MTILLICLGLQLLIEGLPVHALTKALRSRHGGWVLAAAWVASTVWMIAGYKLGMSGRDGFALDFAVLSVLAAPALAMVATLIWADLGTLQEQSTTLASTRPGPHPGLD